MLLHPMELDVVGRTFYRTALSLLLETRLPFLVGGAYALERHTGIVRHTKDFDIFVRPQHVRRALRILSRAGYQTDLPFPHWIGKVFHGEYFIDVIFNSGNGVCAVDDEWFEHALDNVVLDLPVKICPVEETIWQKAFILERDRCDSADVAHLLRFCAKALDWDRLIRRFAAHWRVLLAHLVLFGFIYPGEQKLIPRSVMETLTRRLRRDEVDAAAARLCNGTLLSATQYLRDIDLEGFTDTRLPPHGLVEPDALAKWTANFVNP
jgi:putative nucleotidyltransferase-like protein